MVMSMNTTQNNNRYFAVVLEYIMKIKFITILSTLYGIHCIIETDVDMLNDYFYILLTLNDIN
jgi:uncharacterized membrane protein YeiB